MTSDFEAGYFQELLCQELVELVTDYLDGAMVPGDQLCFEQHLARCDGCAHYLAEIRKTVKVGATLGKEWITPAAKAQLLSAFRGWQDVARTHPQEGR
ncbi:MAG TPA: zf-HC2 domain-containing protein [Pseudonocardiaceae bacterium]